MVLIIKLFVGGIFVNEIDVDIQKVIDYVLKENKDIKFKACTKCGRNLPCHDWFYNKHSKGRFGYDTRCKECISKNNTYKFTNNIKWYHGIEEEFKSNFRIMTDYELADYYDVKKQDIINYIKKLGLKNLGLLNTYTDKEIIFMYNSILNGKRKSFPNGLLQFYKYKLVLVRYLINNILKWDREQICNNFNNSILIQYKLASIINKSSLYDLINNSFPEYNIKKWELRSSSVYNWDKEMIEDVSKWLKNKLSLDKNINNIKDAWLYGFSNIISEYHLDGLLSTKFNFSYTNF